MDKEVLREIWQGQLPLCFKLHSDDVHGMHRPEPYYMMVSRVTYFPLVLDRVVKYFTRFMDQSRQEATNDMWLDYDGQPIKWHHPIGLSWDLFGSSYDLPWKLMLHFSSFPSTELLRCNTKAAVETNFISSIKEADSLKHKGSVVKNMVKKDQTQLWSGLLNDKFDQFWSINKRLMEKVDNELFRFIPFRLYFPDYTYVQKVIKPCTTDKNIFKGAKTTRAVPLISDPGVFDTEIVINKMHKCSHSAKLEAGVQLEAEHRSTTMLDLIQVSFVNRMSDLLSTSPTSSHETFDDDHHRQVDDQSPDNNVSAEETSADNTRTDDNPTIDVSQFRYRFMSHGIEIPFDTPLQWLSEHFSYPDNFLHVCAVLKRNQDYSP